MKPKGIKELLPIIDEIGYSPTFFEKDVKGEYHCIEVLDVKCKIKQFLELSLIDKWLREKKEVFILPRIIGEKTWALECNVGPIRQRFAGNPYDNLEEALFDGVCEAVNFIKGNV